MYFLTLQRLFFLHNRGILCIVLLYTIFLHHQRSRENIFFEYRIFFLQSVETIFVHQNWIQKYYNTRVLDQKWAILVIFPMIREYEIHIFWRNGIYAKWDFLLIGRRNKKYLSVLCIHFEVVWEFPARYIFCFCMRKFKFWSFYSSLYILTTMSYSCNLKEFLAFMCICIKYFF